MMPQSVFRRSSHVFKKIMFPGKYIQGIGVLAELPSLVELFGKKGLILASPTPYKEILPKMDIHLSGHSLSVERFGGECCEKELSRLAEVIREKNVDVVVAIGGGKAIDTAKIAADRASIPVIVVPT
jgi:glycerol dehydrogenase